MPPERMIESFDVVMIGAEDNRRRCGLSFEQAISGQAFCAGLTPLNFAGTVPCAA
jgi:hypothetical protein